MCNISLRNNNESLKTEIKIIRTMETELHKLKIF